MITNQRRVLTYGIILDLVWKEPFDGAFKKTVINHIYNLRKKLKVSPDVPDYIKNVHDRKMKIRAFFRDFQRKNGTFSFRKIIFRKPLCLRIFLLSSPGQKSLSSFFSIFLSPIKKKRRKENRRKNRKKKGFYSKKKKKWENSRAFQGHKEKKKDLVHYESEQGL